MDEIAFARGVGAVHGRAMQQTGAGQSLRRGAVFFPQTFVSTGDHAESLFVLKRFVVGEFEFDEHEVEGSIEKRGFRLFFAFFLQIIAFY